MIKIPAGLTASQKQLIIFIAIASLITLVLYFNLLLMPQLRWAASSIARMGRAEADLKNARRDISKIEKLSSDMASYKEKVESYEAMLPAEQDIPPLLEALSAMAKDSGVKIVGIMPVAKKEDASGRQGLEVYKEIPILISAKSGYHELGRFLAGLENAGRFMKVADIQIRANTQTPKKHDVELLVLTYVLTKGQ